jgi:hypothetical protein
MAEMNDRGQLLLVAGVLLAVLFVALALLINTAIYTDNVATRGGDSAGETLEYQAGITDAVGGLLDAENANSSHADRGDIVAAVRDGTETIDAVNRRNHLRRGAATKIRTASISSENATDGVLIRRNEPGTIGNWSADGATGVRAFDVAFESDTIGSEPFNVTLGATKLFIYESASDEHDYVVAENSTGNVICGSNATGTVRFEVTDGEFGGTPCRIGWSTIDEVRFQNNGSVSGTYNLTVEASDTTGFPAGVEATEAIYSADVELRVDTPEIRYETTVTVAPGEPDV